MMNALVLAGAGVLLVIPLALADLAAESMQRQSTVITADAVTTVPATVNRVIDGHSLDAHVLGNRMAVGYLGVETPPTNTQCGQTALGRNRELAAAGVLLEEDQTHQFDVGGRQLYYAYTLGGQLIDEVLIREGLGRAVRTDARYGLWLSSVQAEAETAKRGCLWSE